MFCVLGMRCWSIDGIRQMYLHVFVCYWSVLPLGEHMFTNILAYGYYPFICSFSTLRPGLFTLYLQLYMLDFYLLLSGNLFVCGISCAGFGILLLPNVCGGNLHVSDVTY